jgi:hypothetical protein
MLIALFKQVLVVVLYVTIIRLSQSGYLSDICPSVMHPQVISTVLSSSYSLLLTMSQSRSPTTREYLNTAHHRL